MTNAKQFLTFVVACVTGLAVTCFGYNDLQMVGESGHINYYQSFDYYGSVSDAGDTYGSQWGEENWPNSETLIAYYGTTWVQRDYYTWTWYGGSSDTWTWSYSPVFGAHSSCIIEIYRSSDCLLSFGANGYAPGNLGGSQWILYYAN